MAAASSTPTRRIPSRTQRRCRNLLQIVSIFALGAALTNVFGRMVGDQRQGWAILAAMAALFLAGVVVCYWAEAAGNPNFAALGLDPANMEGKEVRFGVPLSRPVRGHHHCRVLRRRQCHA